MSFFNTLIGFTDYCNYKLIYGIDADSPRVYTFEKVLNLGTIDKLHLKCDCMNGSLVNSVREPVHLSFMLDKPPGYKVFYEHDTVLYKKINLSVLITITFVSEDDDHKEVNFNGKTLTFSLKLIEM